MLPCPYYERVIDVLDIDSPRFASVTFRIKSRKSSNEKEDVELRYMRSVIQ